VNEETVARFEQWFMSLVNLWRDRSPSDDYVVQVDLVRAASTMYQLPQWMVLRVGNDMRRLTPESTGWYHQLLAERADHERY
jgi:hypothetical protein